MALFKALALIGAIILSTGFVLVAIGSNEGITFSVVGVSIIIALIIAFVLVDPEARNPNLASSPS
jgi:hypothetical protein